VRAALNLSLCADRGTQLFQHVLLALTDLRCTEAHEAAFLGGIGGCLRARKEPLLERRSLLGGRF
jgi:hypothetical protein